MKFTEIPIKICCKSFGCRVTALAQNSEIEVKLSALIPVATAMNSLPPL